jgi:hypothetical protein
MTEQEWLECTDPQLMLKLLWWGRASDRKLRLFAVACCRRVWRFLTDSRSKEAIERAEEFAEGRLAVELLQEAESDAWEAYQHQNDAAYHASQAAVWAAHDSGEFAAREAAYTVIAATVCDPTDPEEDNIYQAISLRCIIGNPFRPVTINPTWLAWNDGTVRKIAQSIYDERAFDRMPILADALTDAGCDHADLLNHCRDEGPHVKGCWVVDLLLGKE